MHNFSHYIIRRFKIYFLFHRPINPPHLNFFYSHISNPNPYLKTISIENGKCGGQLWKSLQFKRVFNYMHPFLYTFFYFSNGFGSNSCVTHTHTQDFFLKSDNFASQLNSKIGGPFTMLHTIIFKTKLV